MFHSSLAQAYAPAGLALAFLLAAAPTAPALAQSKVDADLAKYCRTKFPNSTPTIRRGIDHYCNRGGSLQGIDLAEACRLTTGSRRYERLGARVLCFKTRAGAPRPGPRTDADLAKYCRTKYPNSTPTRRGTRHYCNQGGTLQGVDLAEACRLTTGSRRYQVSGARVLCRGNARPATARRRGAGEPDYARYCRARHPNSVYLFNSGLRAHLCSQPGATGGRTLHRVNLAEACRLTYGTRRYRRDGHRVLCTGRRRASAGTTRGTYVWPRGGVIYRGPLKNGKPHGIGVNRNPKTGFMSVAQYRNGKAVGPFLIRFRGKTSCVRVYPNRRSKRLPLSRCAHLRRHLP